MAFDCSTHHRKPLLFSDLFKNHRNMAMEKEQQDASLLITAPLTSPSSSSTQFLSSWDSSSSSGFSSPLHSDFGDSEGDDGDFITELTRQVAECMLDEEESNVDEESGYENSGAVSSIGSELYSSSVRLDVPTQTNVHHVYQLKNQPPVSKEGKTWGRRVPRSEPAQPKPLQKAEQQYKKYRGTEWGGVGRNGYYGSGMQAVFIGGSRSRIGSNGTGVFLPREPTQLKTKSGCSMVLMPTRVLQVLEQHFSRIQQDSNGPPPSGGYLRDEHEPVVSNGPGIEHVEPEIRPVDGDEMQLPLEWTY